MKPAIFLDRDGTIIKDNGYINNIKSIEFYPYTFDCLRKLQEKFLLFIVTNQSGISKGLVTLKELEIIHEYILKKLKENGIKIEEIYSCPHLKEENCICRKPSPHFIKKAKEKYSIDVENSYVIGDHPSDMEFAINAKAKGILVLTGHGKKHYKELPKYRKIKICLNLKSATNTILFEV
jgi:D-glycero-D-manno-heptose 1,7-bisphosphate phosphatase